MTITDKILDVVYTRMSIQLLELISTKEYNPQDEIKLKEEVVHARKIIDEIIDEMERKEIVKIVLSDYDDWKNDDGEIIVLTRKEVYEWQDEVYES